MSEKFRLDRKIVFQNTLYTKCINVIIDSIGPSIILRSIYETFQKAKTKALISLRGCAGWSAPLLFAYPGKFSRVDVHLRMMNITEAFCQTLKNAHLTS